MNLSHLVVLTVFLGIASCDEVCMLFKISRCHLELGKRYDQSSLCIAHAELTECIGSGAEDCGMELDSIVQEIQKVYTDVCTEGTEMNRLFKKHNECVFRNTALGNRVCSNSATKEISDLGFLSDTRVNRVKVLNIGCKYGRSGDQCIQDNINRSCGSEAAEFQRRVSSPSIKLSDQACTAIDDEGNVVQMMASRSIYDYVINMLPQNGAQPANQRQYEPQTHDQTPLPYVPQPHKPTMVPYVPLPYKPTPLPYVPLQNIQSPTAKQSSSYHHYPFEVTTVAEITKGYTATTIVSHLDGSSSAAKANDSQRLIGILAVTLFLKWFTQKYINPNLLLLGLQV